MQKIFTPFAFMLPLANLVAAQKWQIYENNTIYCVAQLYSCDLPSSESSSRVCDLPQLEDPNSRFEYEYYWLPDPKIGGAINIPTGVVAVAYTATGDFDEELYEIVVGNGQC